MTADKSHIAECSSHNATNLHRLKTAPASPLCKPILTRTGSHPLDHVVPASRSCRSAAQGDSAAIANSGQQRCHLRHPLADRDLLRAQSSQMPQAMQALGALLLLRKTWYLKRAAGNVVEQVRVVEELEVRRECSRHWGTACSSRTWCRESPSAPGTSPAPARSAPAPPRRNPRRATCRQSADSLPPAPWCSCRSEPRRLPADPRATASAHSAGERRTGKPPSPPEYLSADRPAGRPSAAPSPPRPGPSPPPASARASRLVLRVHVVVLNLAEAPQLAAVDDLLEAPRTRRETRSPGAGCARRQARASARSSRSCFRTISRQRLLAQRVQQIEVDVAGLQLAQLLVEQPVKVRRRSRPARPAAWWPA